MDSSRKTTLKDIARVAEVSSCLVSKILSGSDSKVWFSQETRERVLRTAKDLNYRPNFAARKLVNGRMDSIGVFLGNNIAFCSAFFMRILQGVVDRADELGYNVNMGTAVTSSKISFIESGAIDSAVLIPAERSLTDSLAELLRKEGIPYVTVNPGKALDFNAVYCDDAGGVRKALSYLFSLGHRRIIYAGTPIGTHASGETRLSAYLDFMRENNMEPTTVLCEHATSGFISTAVRKDGVTAFLLYDDGFLVNFYISCYSVGLEIPGDISVIGINDLPGSDRFIPAPTSVQIPIYEMGTTGVDLLDRLVRGDSPIPSVKIEETLSIRGSCRNVKVCSNKKKKEA